MRSSDDFSIRFGENLHVSGSRDILSEDVIDK